MYFTPRDLINFKANPQQAAAAAAAVAANAGVPPRTTKQLVSNSQ